MKIKINNVGKIKYAEVKLDGITTLAGPNGSGKSTVSKSVYSTFSSLYNIHDKVEKDIVHSIIESIDNFLTSQRQENNIHRSSMRRRQLRQAISKRVENEIFDKFDELDSDDSTKQVDLILTAVIEESHDNDLDLNIEDLSSLKTDINEILNQQFNSIAEQILTANFQGEFNNQINNIYDDTSGSIELVFKQNKNIILNIINNQIHINSDLISINKDVVYIDDSARIIDQLYDQNSWISLFNNDENHNNHLLAQLESDDLESNTSKAIVDEKLSKVFNIITETIGDNSTNKTDSLPNSKYKLNISNYSSGMKTFYIIKELLMKGIIVKNGVLILDEPEVHLNPEWQLKLAEIIVVLRKVFELHILINTHSPYILNALEVYSKIYNITTDCYFYLCELKDGYANINKVGDTEKIYDSLAMPMQELEDLEKR